LRREGVEEEEEEIRSVWMSLRVSHRQEGVFGVLKHTVLCECVSHFILKEPVKSSDAATHSSA